MKALHDRLRRSLSARIVALFLGLLLAVQAASFTAIRASIDSNARAGIDSELQVGERVFRRLLEQNAQKLTQGASLLAADYGFREAVGSNDVETVASVLDNHGDRIGASLTVLLDTQFQVRATAHKVGPSLGSAVARLAARAAVDRVANDIVVLGAQPYQVVLVPMRAPVVVAWVLMGFPLDQRLVGDMRALSSLHVALQVRAGEHAPWQADISTLGEAAAQQLAGQAGALLHAPALMAQAAHALVLPDGEYGARAVALTPADAGGAAVSALLMRSVDEAVAPYRQLQLVLAALTALGVLVVAIGSIYTARRVTTPLSNLVAAAERLGRGDYTTPMRGVRRDDEIGELANAFESMRESVATQQQEIRKLAFWDTLTGLPNRVQFRDAVQAAIKAATERQPGADAHAGRVAVIMLDLDRFKHVNDVLGYRFGDLLLVAVAQRLSSDIVRGADLVARLGGDEFAVLLPEADVALALGVAQRVAKAFEQPLALEQQTIDIGAGIGVACWPQHASDADTLLSRAEVAMYAAKLRTDGPLLYDAALDAASTQTLCLLSELRHAVDHGELRLYLQPKLALDSGRVVGAEALVRWQHPQRGLVPPMQFIPFAEQTGFVRVLTMWIFEEAARTWKRLHGEGMELVMSVNLSTRDLLDTELPRKFDALMVKHGVPAEGFCLEITESAIMDDPQRALVTLERLSALGFKLSIDDFGTGYSSLAYLKRLPVDELKIDQSFVRTMETDPDDAKIVRSTIDLAHNLGLCVVAEGVETAKSWDMLRELNCDLAQGYHMGKPMPHDEFARWSVGWASRQRRPSLGSAALVLH